MQPLKLLIVEEDRISQKMLSQILSTFAITIADSGENALKAFSALKPDMILLESSLAGMSGYETCRALREMEGGKNIPIIFISYSAELGDRLKAYNAGGSDYILKPFDVAELLKKIEVHSATVTQMQTIDRDLSESHGMLMEVQTSSARLQSISRFNQVVLFCHDIDSLYAHFFKAANELGINCVLQITIDGVTDIRSTEGTPSVLELEILDISAKLDRIHSFGEDRAVFRWGHATLLARNVGEMIDIIAIFMGGLEAGIVCMSSEQKLLLKMTELEEQNMVARERVGQLFELMSEDLKDSLLSLGVTSGLDVDEEEHLNKMINGFGRHIDAELRVLGENNQVMHKLIEALRAAPPELEDLSLDDSGDGFELF